MKKLAKTIKLSELLKAVEKRNLPWLSLVLKKLALENTCTLQELTEYLHENGFEISKNRLCMALKRLEEKNIVKKIEHGVYTLNRDYVQVDFENVNTQEIEKFAQLLNKAKVQILLKCGKKMKLQSIENLEKAIELIGKEIQIKISEKEFEICKVAGLAILIEE